MWWWGGGGNVAARVNFTSDKVFIYVRIKHCVRQNDCERSFGGVHYTNTLSADFIVVQKYTYAAVV